MMLDEYINEISDNEAGVLADDLTGDLIDDLCNGVVDDIRNVKNLLMTFLYLVPKELSAKEKTVSVMVSTGMLNGCFEALMALTSRALEDAEELENHVADAFGLKTGEGEDA